MADYLSAERRHNAVVVYQYHLRLVVAAPMKTDYWKFVGNSHEQQSLPVQKQ